MTVKEFYEWCVEHGIENYNLECYGISQFGDVSFRTEVIEQNIHVDELYEGTVILFVED